MKKESECGILDKIIVNTNKVVDMILNTRTKKIVVLSISGFVIGALLTAGTIHSVNKISFGNAAGGFETQNIPQFISEDQSVLPEFSDDISDELPPLVYKTYRVKTGDMIGIIADENNISQDTLISVNNIKSTRLLQVGQYLKIPSMPGILYTVRTDNETFDTIAAKYEIDAKKIADVNSVAFDMSLKAGNTLFLPDAQMDWITRQEINGDLFHNPIKGRYRISSYYGWRNSPFNAKKRTYHGGTDFAASTGTNIYAALDGRVTFTGYNETYGNHVIVTHHSGYKTLYGHMSQITCKKGQYVYTTTILGKVGSTGMSTGPHLHFAVYKNGKSTNPLGVMTLKR